MNPLDLVWAAGFFDGEGSVSIVLYKGRFMFRLLVGNTDVRPLHVFKELFGGSISPHAPKMPNAKPAYQWQVVSKQAALALRYMLPYLRVKQEQAEIALQYAELVRSDRRTPLTPVEIDQRVGLMAQLRVLNKRGVS